MGEDRIKRQDADLIPAKANPTVKGSVHNSVQIMSLIHRPFIKPQQFKQLQPSAGARFILLICTEKRR